MTRRYDIVHQESTPVVRVWMFGWITDRFPEQSVMVAPAMRNDSLLTSSFMKMQYVRDNIGHPSKLE